MIRTKKSKRGFSLIEIMLAMLIVAMGTMSTLSLISYAHMQNAIEMERARAHQIVSEEIELARFDLYPRIREDDPVVVWDNGTPNLATDDTEGIINVTVRDPYTGESLTAAPVPARVLLLEVTLEWNPRGRLGNKTFRETEMTYISPRS